MFYLQAFYCFICHLIFFKKVINASHIHTQKNLLLKSIIFAVLINSWVSPFILYILWDANVSLLIQMTQWTTIITNNLTLSFINHNQISMFIILSHRLLMPNFMWWNSIQLYNVAQRISNNQLFYLFFRICFLCQSSNPWFGKRLRSIHYQNWHFVRFFCT